MPEEKKKQNTVGSVLSGLLFLLLVVGGPLLNGLRRLLGSSLALPNNLLPLLIAGLVALSALVAVGRTLSRSARRRSDTRLPSAAQPPLATSAPRSIERPGAPGQLPSASALPAAYERPVQLPQTPRFDPILPPGLLLVALVGVLVLAGLAFIVFGAALP